MQWILCSLVKCIRIERSGFHAASVNAEDSLHCGTMDPVCIQLSSRSEAQCIPIECSGFYAAWPKVSRLNAVDSMQQEEMEPYSMQGIFCSMIECSGFLQHDWMQWIFCSMAQSIPIECSGFHAASLNAEDSLHCCAMDPDCIQWRPRSEDKCILSECIGFYAAWHKISRLNAADSLQHDWMQWILCSMAKASRLNAVDSL